MLKFRLSKENNAVEFIVAGTPNLQIRPVSKYILAKTNISHNDIIARAYHPTTISDSLHLFMVEEQEKNKEFKKAIDFKGFPFIEKSTYFDKTMEIGILFDLESLAL